MLYNAVDPTIMVEDIVNFTWGLCTTAVSGQGVPIPSHFLKAVSCGYGWTAH